MSSAVRSVQAQAQLHPIGEFELIRRFFVRERAQQVPLGIGDDCALLPPIDCLAISTDMLVAGRHFFADVEPSALGHKTLAVSLSDLAAMGAQPVAFTLAMALPDVDESWLQAFASGLFELADCHQCELIGGDTTRGPLNLCVTVFGEVRREQALRRDLARPGDDIWVSGELGGAAWAVAERRADSAGGSPTAAARDDAADRGPTAAARDDARRRLHRPVPRVELGIALRGIAHAAIDLSDGLLGDLGHVLARSSAGATTVSGTTTASGATIEWSTVPIHEVLAGLPDSRQVAMALAGGDDYELLFTAPAMHRDRVSAMSGSIGLKLTRIGRIDVAPGIRVQGADGHAIATDARPFDHFR